MKCFQQDEARSKGPEEAGECPVASGGIRTQVQAGQPGLVTVRAEVAAEEGTDRR